ncbi:MAG: ROK family protein [Pirellulales bacterium]|nr:ROK family protein [Pirellulales bacterium]
MFLGIEIGGTKLQLGVGSARDRHLAELIRLDVAPERGAGPIRDQLAEAGRALLARHAVRAVGVGFGGPVDATAGRVVTSHQVDGWTDFDLAGWCRETFGLPVVLSNDSDAAGLAEALLGAGFGKRVVFYTNVGSGIGGSLVIDGELYRGGIGMAVEPGHLRPGLQADRPDQTVESLASGWAITAAVQARLADPDSHFSIDGITTRDPEAVRQRLIEREDAEERDAADLLTRCEGDPDRLDTRMLAEAARHGNGLAREVFDRAARVFGWAVAQVITIAAPNVVVLGGGVSLAGEDVFLGPVRKYVNRYVFPAYSDTFEIVPAALGEAVVVHGALLLAARLAGDR